MSVETQKLTQEADLWAEVGGGGEGVGQGEDEGCLEVWG